MNKYEKLFHSFLCEWLEWARSYDECNDDEHESFSPHTGLCCCLENYLENLGYSWSMDNTSEKNRTYLATMQLFRSTLFQDGLCQIFPFGEVTYDRDAEDGTQHKNKDRILWVEKTINKLEAK